MGRPLGAERGEVEWRNHSGSDRHLEAERDEIEMTCWTWRVFERERERERERL